MLNFLFGSVVFWVVVLGLPYYFFIKISLITGRIKHLRVEDNFDFMKEKSNALGVEDVLSITKTKRDIKCKWVYTSNSSNTSNYD